MLSLPDSASQQLSSSLVGLKGFHQDSTTDWSRVLIIIVRKFQVSDRVVTLITLKSPPPPPPPKKKKRKKEEKSFQNIQSRLPEHSILASETFNLGLYYCCRDWMSRLDCYPTFDDTQATVLVLERRKKLGPSQRCVSVSCTVMNQWPWPHCPTVSVGWMLLILSIMSYCVCGLDAIDTIHPQQLHGEGQRGPVHWWAGDAWRGAKGASALVSRRCMEGGKGGQCTGELEMHGGGQRGPVHWWAGDAWRGAKGASALVSCTIFRLLQVVFDQLLFYYRHLVFLLRKSYLLELVMAGLLLMLL